MKKRKKENLEEKEKNKSSSKYTRLNPSALALTLGIFGAVFILLTIITIKLSAAPEVSGLGEFGMGRIMISIVYGFIDGVIIGVIFAWLYNKLNEKIRY